MRWRRSLDGSRAVAVLLGTATLLVPPGAGSVAARQAGQETTGAVPARALLEVRVIGADGEPVPGVAAVLERLGSGPAGASGASGPPPSGSPPSAVSERDRARPGEAGTSLELRPIGPSRYRSPPLATGTYRLWVQAPGYAAWRRELSPAGGEVTRVEVRLRPAAALRDLVARAEADGGATAGHAIDRVRFAERAVAAASLGEWLDGLAGVDVRRRGPGGRQVVSVRGSRPEGVLVLLDGLPLNDPMTGAADLSTIPTSTLESATLVRGAVPGAGPGALGGVLLLRSREASGTGATVGLEAGSFGRVATDLHFGAGGERGALTVAARYEEARNDFDFRNRIHPRRPVERRRNADHRSWHGSLVGRPASLPVALRLRWDRTERGTPGRMGTRVFDDARWEEGAWQAVLEAEPGPWVSGGVGMRLRSMRYLDPRLAVDERHRATDLRLHADLHPDEAGRWSGRLHAGLERVVGDRLADASPRPRAGVAVARRIGGARLEFRPALSLESAAGELAAVPSIAVTGRPGAGWSAWARLGRAFRPPTFSDLYFASARGVEPNPDLRPERVVLDGELGISRGRVGGGAFLRVVGFTRLTRSPIVWLPSSVAVWSPRNLGRLLARGVEVDAAIEPLDGWRVEASGTLESSRVGSGASDRPLPYVPALRGRIAVERGWRSVGARLELRAVGDRVTTLAGSHELPAFAVLDLTTRARVEVGSLPLTLRLALRNVLDVEHELIELFPEPGRAMEVGLRVGPFPRE